MNKVTFLVGNIGSGKSTYTWDFEGPILCKDVLREEYAELIGKEYIHDPTLEEIIHDMTLDALEGMLLIGVKEIIIDETSVSKGIRAPYLYLAKKYGYVCEAIIFENRGMESHVDNRMNAPRGEDREYWEGVYNKLQGWYQHPTEEEGFDVITDYAWGQEA